jgi:ADP-ribose pyrophosphatase
MPIKPWKLLSSTDVSPSTWFPIERRTYELPNGKIIDDFTITTLPDVAMILPITAEGKIVFVSQYKPGTDEVMIQFPAGRIEPEYQDMTEAAQHELEEEVGIKVTREQLKEFGVLSGFSTKATERVYAYLAIECSFNSTQRLDETEDIEVLVLSPAEVEEAIINGKIWCSLTIAGWELAKKKFPDVFTVKP